MAESPKFKGSVESPLKTSSYLAGVKTKVREVFDAAFEELWKEVIEPALKQSYRNGVEAGKGGLETPAAPQPQGRRFVRPKGGDGE